MTKYYKDMKKIMFDDRFGLTKAVLEGRKTMTRRIVPEKQLYYIRRHFRGLAVMEAPFKAGEVVAVAQKYKDVREGGYPVDSRYDAFREADWGIGMNGALKGSAGETNKMFVRAELMPHKIRIKNVRVERLQDITSEDALREGIYCDYANLQYSFPTEIGYCGQYPFGTARDAFADLIDRVSGKGTWESNPWVFVYDFELVK